MNFRILLFISLSFFAINTVYAQKAGGKPKSPKQVMKEQAKKEKKEAKEIKKGQAKLLKQHAKNQTKDVRKRMKKSAKAANRQKLNKKEVFYKRWFSKNQRKKRKKKN